MKVSLNWLKEYVNAKDASDNLAHRLTMAGMEVEKIHRVAGDTVFELEITPNRPDCLNHIGLAREISAIYNKNLKTPRVKKPSFTKNNVGITIEDKKDCARYIGAILKNVNIKSAPTEIKNKILALGGRCINNIVDITNFCLFETGQPMHAFDFDKLAGGQIIVRRARKGETIITIDDVKRELDPSILIIADNEKPVAIAGLMGGKETEVSGTTKNILLESAYFDPILIRRASRQLGLSSDSSYRFERGVDIMMVEQAAYRAVELFRKTAGGKVFALKDLYPKKVTAGKKAISLSLDEASAFLGTRISGEKAKAILGRLGFKIATQKMSTLKVTAPSFRTDIVNSPDLLEEIARIIGYDRLPVRIPAIKPSSIRSSEAYQKRQIISDCLCACGLDEVITFSMTSKEALEKAGCGHLAALEVQNPLSREQELMRPTLLPGLLDIVSQNLHKGQKDMMFFECGKIYSAQKESETLGAIITGARAQNWQSPARDDYDFFTLKGAIVGSFQKAGSFSLKWTLRDDPLFRNAGAVILIEGQAIGKAGNLNKEMLLRWNIKNRDVYYAQIDLHPVYQSMSTKVCYQPIPSYPSMVRDISLAVNEAVLFEKIKETIIQNAGAHLQSVDLTEQYLGEKVAKGHRGLVVSLTYQAMDRTLTEEEINAAQQRVRESLQNSLKATLR